MNEKVAAQDDPHRFEILTLAHRRQCEAIDYHNDLAFKIFSWSTTWLFASTGFIFSQSAQLRITDRIFLAIAVTVFSGMSLWWQNRNRLQTLDHAENLTRLNKLFHLREPGYFDKEPIYGTELHTRQKPVRHVHLAYHIALLIVTFINLGLLLRV